MIFVAVVVVACTASGRWIAVYKSWQKRSIPEPGGSHHHYDDRRTTLVVLVVMLLFWFQSMLVTMILVVVEELVVVVATSVAMCAIICVTFCVWHTHEQFVECAMECM